MGVCVCVCVWFEATSSDEGRTVTVASHPFVTCPVLDPQMKRIAEYVHIRALAGTARPQQPSLKLTLCLLNARQASQLSRLLCSSCSRMPQQTTLRQRITSIIISRRQSTALRLRTFYSGDKKIKGRIQQRLLSPATIWACPQRQCDPKKLFLATGHLIMKLRTRLLPETAELLMFLNKNISPVHPRRRPIV